VKKIILLSVATVVLWLGVQQFARAGRLVATPEADPRQKPAVLRNSGPGPLPALDAHGFKGVREIGKTELVELMSKLRPLSLDESTNLNRGCLGLTCAYQGLGLKRWPELAPGTVAYLTREKALNRRCRDGQQNFVFVKQGWWLEGRPPTPHRFTGEVAVDSVTRMKPGFYTFNYAVYFPSTETYAWMNHREYGFPLNLFDPQKAYLSSSPPPLDRNRPAQIYCSTCK
jgi:hypothetical protein